MVNRICHQCLIEKDESDFYNSNRTRNNCKQCEKNCSSKIELYYCEICNITIRKRCLNNHLLTKTHLRSKITGQNNIHKKINGQCLRKS